MKKNIQTVIQIAFLAVFVAVVITGKMPLWLGIFIGGVVLSIFLGRLFCGYVCPINTLMEAVSFIKRKLRIKNFNSPTFLKKKPIRYSALVLFFVAFIFVMVSGKPLPVLPLLVILGVVSTIFFSEELWHRFLCPYGTIFSFASRKSSIAMKIDPEKCNNCSACTKVCPANSITRDEKTHSIEKNECIVCRRCSRVCNQSAIKYR